jgi:hypothetical protein
MRRRASALLATALVAATSVELETASWADDTEHASLRAELGLEYDTNAQRTELVGSSNPALVRSPLGRGVLTGALSDLIAPGQTIALAATLGGKLFTKPEARSENVGVVSTSAQWRLRLAERANLGVAGFYYEAFQQGDQLTTSGTASQRGDFRSLAPSARVGFFVDDHAEIALTGGYRLLVFKPNLDYSFSAPTGALDLRWLSENTEAGVDWELGAGIGFERRVFEGPALTKGNCSTSASGTCPPVPTALGRHDEFATGHVELTRTGLFLIGLGYIVHWNDSNSVGETLQRHFVSLRLTTGLPLGLYLAARGELLIARYADPVVLASTTASQSNYPDIDRENRSSLRVDLSRAFTDNLQLIARYTVYVNELGDSVGHYHRQTALLSLAFTLDK